MSRTNLIQSTFAAIAALLIPAHLAAAPGAGDLSAIDREGHIKAPCPLKRTEVKAEITGFLSRVTVTQRFQNPLSETIEAVYTFPLPHNAAVDDMTMLIGDRIVKGKIKPREEARAIFEAARNAGKAASLLEQERANIFTQSVTNIKPGQEVKITISYVETLKYEAGTYEFVFPMVVGPRYIPGKPTGKQAGGWAPDTNRVPDASRITPQVTPPGTRAGHDITVEVAIDAGFQIDSLTSGSHEVLTERPDPKRAVVKLKNQAVIPNKDFILRYDVAGARIQDTVLAHRAARGGFFSLILQPPDRPAATEITPKELVFVLDTSGSMSGFPIEKSKEVMRMALANMNPRDTFNIITFAGDTAILFPEPVPATPENVRRAQDFVNGRRGSGGTEMMKAIRAALDPTDSLQHVRVVAFLTDGYIGNDQEIIAEIQKHKNARVFSFGIGSAVNRFLLDKMAEHGRGEAEFVTLNDDGSAAAKRFFERMRNPLLTDIRVDWAGLPVSDVFPRNIPDLFSAKPVVIHGRYTGPAKGAIRVTGKIAGREIIRTVNVDLPAAEVRHDVLASLWARTKIEDLMATDYRGAQNNTMSDSLRNEITRLGLDYRLMTQFTAFVAVEEKVVNEGGKVTRMDVPVEMPEGVSYEGVFGERDRQVPAAGAVNKTAMLSMRNNPYFGGTRREAVQAMPAAPPPPMMADRVEARPKEIKAVPAGRKLHPDVAQAITAKTAWFVKAGKADLKIYLTDNSPAAIQALKACGFEVSRHDATASVVSGKIALDKLEAVQKLGFVRFISPADR